MLKMFFIAAPVVVLMVFIFLHTASSTAKERISDIIPQETKAEVINFISHANGTWRDIMYDEKAAGFPQHTPYGNGVGIYPGRVVWAHDAASVKWDGQGYWWQTNNFDEARIKKMLEHSITSLTGTDSTGEAWQKLFLSHNEPRGIKTGYQPGEKIAIKVNLNSTSEFSEDYSGKTQLGYVNPVLLKTMLLCLVDDAHVRPEDITVYDVSRLFPRYMIGMCSEGRLSGINFVGRDTAVADKNVPLIWSKKFDDNDTVSYLPTVVTQATYLINLANLKGHSWGVSLCAKNNFGSFLNSDYVRPPVGANLHPFLTDKKMDTYTPLVDLMANNELGGKTILYMLDALIVATSEESAITGETARWQQYPFNNDYTASLFVSQDPVAIDSVGADFLMNEPVILRENGAIRHHPEVESYLHEAGQIAAAPSGVTYRDGTGQAVNNIGVHAHWINAEEKIYDYDKKNKNCIEFIALDANK